MGRGIVATGGAVAALAAVALSLIAVGCSRSSAPAAGRAFVIAQTSEPRTLDPLLESGFTAEQIGSLVYSYLVRIGPDGSLEPDLAARVPSSTNGDISPDGRTIIYHLRRGVRWQDGAPFEARDVVATYRAVMDARNPVPSRLGYDRVADIRALDPLTLRVRLRERFAPFLTYFFETESYPVLPAHVLAHVGALAGSSFDAAPVGTGPFRVIAWRRGDNLELAANGAYFLGAPHLERLRLEFVPDAQTIALRLQTGEADAFLAADPFVLAQLRTNPRLELRVVPIYGFVALTLQTRDPVLADPAVRRAIARVFDLRRDIAAASHGVLDSRDAMRGLFTWAYVPRTIPPSDARLPPELTLSIDGTRPLARAIAVLMQQEARRAGSALVIRSFAPQQFEATAADAGPLASGKFQLAVHEVLTGADPETSWILACAQIPPTGYNISRFCDARVDEALADALVAVDRARRMRDYALVQSAVARLAPFVAIAQLREIEAIPKDLRGFQPSLETPYYHAERWRRR